MSRKKPKQNDTKFSLADAAGNGAPGKCAAEPKTAQAAKKGWPEKEKPGELDIDTLLGSLLVDGPKETLELLSSLGPDAVPQIKALYDDFMGDIRPLLKMAPALVGMLGKDAAPIVAALITALDELVKADEMQTALAATYKTKAANRWQALAAYEKAGFKRKEAFALVLQDEASTQSLVSNAVRSASVSRE